MKWGRDGRSAPKPRRANGCLGHYWADRTESSVRGRREETIIPLGTSPAALRSIWDISEGRGQWGLKPASSRTCPAGPRPPRHRAEAEDSGRADKSAHCGPLAFGWPEGKARQRCQQWSRACQTLHDVAGGRFWSQADRGTGGPPKGSVTGGGCCRWLRLSSFSSSMNFRGGCSACAHTAASRLPSLSSCSGLYCEDKSVI